MILTSIVRFYMHKGWVFEVDIENSVSVINIDRQILKASFNRARIK
jgi:hypothetical protein